jgi:hypothetical protein
MQVDHGRDAVFGFISATSSLSDDFKAMFASSSDSTMVLLFALHVNVWCDMLTMYDN